MRPVKIGRRPIGFPHPVYVIAEGGVNHNGDVSIAKKLIDKAKEAGADCIKFQTFKAEEIVTAQAPKANYQLLSTDPKESQFAMLKKLELPQEAFRRLKAHCERVGIEFLSTPYSYGDVDALSELGVSAFKIASGQLTEIPFLTYVAKKRKPIIMSTGMSTLSDVKAAVNAVLRAGGKDLILLQCTTNYPSRVEDAHLRVISTYRKEFRFPVGYSDHTVGDETILGAVALGACVIEKHFTLDKKMPGPDHSSSIEPDDLAGLISKIRTVEKALGKPDKFLAPVEIQNAIGMKRSLAAKETIPKGTLISSEHLVFKRPATGIPPRDLKKVVGRLAAQDIPKDTLLTFRMIRRKVAR